MDGLVVKLETEGAKVSHGQVQHLGEGAVVLVLLEKAASHGPNA
jgi:hypothetical protein